jgi:caa(3)-type oxidase subunit IV
MADEINPEELNQSPNEPTEQEEETRREVEALNEQVARPDEYQDHQAQKLEENIGDETIVDKVFVKTVEKTEELAEESEAVQSFDRGVSNLEAGFEAAGGPPETPQEAMVHAHFEDTTVLFGRTLPYPIYTVVFFALGASTLLEVTIAEIIQVQWLKIPLLLIIALFKALLVVMFYMHLRDDSRIFTVTLILPLVVALVSMLYLLGVPSSGY